MNGKELIFQVFESGKGDRLPWVPFAGVHAGKLKNYTAREVLEDEEKLFESLLEVNKIYQPDGQPILFDLQVEAEALGCELMWEEDSPPTVKNHPLKDTDEIPTKIPQKDEARIPMAMEVTRKMKEAVGDHTALYGLICGPFTLASHLRGTNLFMDMITNPGYVKDLLGYTNKIAKKMASYYIKNGVDIVAAVDPMVSQISPAHFNQFLKEPYTELFAEIKDQDIFASFFVCGDATANIEPMCQTEPDNISIDENIPLEKAKEITDKYDIVLGGNIPLTTVMLLGNQQDNMKWVIDTLDKVSKENLILSPGCDMPYDVPIENSIAVEQAVHEPEQVREMVKNYQAEEINTDAVELPDYENLDRPLIEVFTLDSATCAACTYMKEAAMDVKEEYIKDIDVVEYKYNSKENIARITKVGVKQLPSIYINGQLEFSSIVPNKEELVEAIKKCQ
ncbi:uroporphyrinogen decarboxylase family protein [Halanaerobium hydrogeniformans]|uniref:Uroporphyrinogen decarboxylase (URO-D) n=1 Tax=Halanaerobium hydrogeniformans TaxID=656519 RepID=E4RMD4_HALHG|nr:uroporphyrinogen decarboxylase family protein [Halanaerobium hydrogeniformans]ADQ14465.1 Uroporphyrinogen decarboxylase (URO-D) [Halanaerobium hydrogeniformans]